MSSRSTWTPFPRRNGLSIIASLVFLALIAWLAFRNAGLYPVIFSDEYMYSMNARLRPFSEAAIPSYLFYAAYRTTLLCGDGFLDCVRWMNLAWFVAATPFIWLVARRMTSPLLATAIVLVAVASPFGTYTAMFVPESMYYFAFWLTVWYAIAFAATNDVRYWIGLGLLVGLMSLLKPHALFLLPALYLHGAIATTPTTSTTPARMRTLAVCLVVFVGVFFVVKFGGGYLLAGPRGVTLFGTYYGTAPGLLAKHGGQYGALATSTAFVLKGHGMALVLLFALPLAVLLSTLVGPRRMLVHDPRWRFCVLVAGLFATLVVVAALYTAAVAGVAPSETEGRVHMRYYDFACPLLMIVGCMAISGPSRARTSMRVVAGLVAIVVLYVGLTGFREYQPGLIDGPELYGVGLHATTRRFTALFALAGLALVFWRPRWAALYFAFVVMPWVDWKGVQGSHFLVEIRSVPDAFDEAGVFAHRRLTPEQAGRTRVVADDAAGVFRALFHLDDAKALYQQSTPGQPITSAMLVSPHDRALVIGDHPIIGDDLRSISSGDATLVWKSDDSAPLPPR